MGGTHSITLNKINVPQTSSHIVIMMTYKKKCRREVFPLDISSMSTKDTIGKTKITVLLHLQENGKLTHVSM